MKNRFKINFDRTNIIINQMEKLKITIAQKEIKFMCLDQIT